MVNFPTTDFPTFRLSHVTNTFKSSGFLEKLPRDRKS